MILRRRFFSFQNLWSLLLLVFFLELQGQRLSPLSEEPRWERLHEYQFTITRDRFEKLIDGLYSPDQGIRAYLKFALDSVTIYSDVDRKNSLFTLFFASSVGQARALPHRREVPPGGESKKPLSGIRICLDPGHIGGEFSRLEERYFKIDRDPAIEEATLNLLTCRILEKLLQEEGAEVVWTKQNEEPVTLLRPADLRGEALAWIFDLGLNRYLPIEAEITKRSEMLFYRTAEIRARAERIQNLKPDLTLCVHYNAAAWGTDLNRPKMVDKSKLVIFTSGCYLKDEIKYDDQKYDLFFNLLEQQEALELDVSVAIAAQMKESFKMEPELYKNWSSVLPMKQSSYVYARNLAANRWFSGATVFVEGPYMNALDTYERLVAGDYEGLKMIRGENVPSIHRQFAQTMRDGVVDYFKNHRLKDHSSKKVPPILINP